MPSNRQVFFSGIGGIGMSGLARLMKAQGVQVSGSDSSESETTRELLGEGIAVNPTQKEENISDSLDLLVYSEAVPPENPERQEAKKLGIQEKSYFEALGEFTSGYEVIAVSGTHGKTTTTAMLGLILIEAGLDPTVLVGSKLEEFGHRNVRVGSSKLFLVEACEYRRSFLSLRPALLGVTNMELDHLDYYLNETDYFKAFQEFSQQSQETIWPHDYSVYQGLLSVPGEHNRMNAGLAQTMALRLGAKAEAITSALKNFKGTWRRMEYKGLSGAGALLYDDYAHHPTEIRASLAALREKFPKNRLIAVFQPHQYSRTAALLDEFASSFKDADEVIIPNIYAARDSSERQNAVNLEILVQKIGEHHPKVMNGEDFNATANYLNQTLKKDEICIFMGAGDLNKIIPQILSKS